MTYGRSSTPALAPLAPVTRAGPGYWLSSLWWMLRFDFGQARPWAATMVLVQVLMGSGMALMYGFFYPQVTPVIAAYIATGTPALALIPLGFVMLPGQVGQQKLAGTFDFIWSLPVPRTAQAMSTFLLYTLLSLPGMVLALVVAVFRYGVTLSISPEIAPAAVLCSLMAVSVGFGMALAIPDPMITNVITNTLVFVVLLFSPIVFPPGNLPGWLFAVHRALPFYNMAVVIRAGLTHGLVTGVTQSFLILAAWTVAGSAVTAWAVGRRR
jgi:ABC-2 type transport system permease protein